MSQRNKRREMLAQDRAERLAFRARWVLRNVEHRPHPSSYGQRASQAMWRREYDMQMQDRHWLRTLRRGQEVSACYDGKGGRAVRGTVVKARKGWAVVEFPRWAGEGTARVRFVDGAGWDRGGESMRAFGVGRDRGDFYRIVPIEQCPPREDESGTAAVVRALRAAVVSAATEAVCPAV